MTDKTYDDFDQRIPKAGEDPYDTTEAPRKDVVYQVTSPDGSVTRKYVTVTEVYGDKGIARCKVVRSYDASAAPLDSSEELTVDFERLVRPDVFPELATNIPKWVECSAMPLEELKAYAATLIDIEFDSRRVTAFDMTDDIDRTIKAIKKLLVGKIGGFFLTILLSFITSKLRKKLDASIGNKPQPEKFNRRLADMRRMYSEKGPRAVTEDEAKTEKIKSLQKQLQTKENALKSAKPAVKPKLNPISKAPAKPAKGK